VITTGRAATIAICMIFLTALVSISSAAAQQGSQAEEYSFHTNVDGTCPALDWHFVVDQANSVAGFVISGQFKHSIVGSIDANGDFQGKVTETAGSRSIGLSGRLSQKSVTLAINGLGSACNKRAWIMRHQPDLVVYSVSGG
jgi:hypothetical protein